MAWKFPDPPDTGVYTTRQVFVDGAPLALVSHDPDGDWQFLHDEEGDGDLRNEDDLMFVPLQQLVDRLPEVKQFADLLVGWFALRETPDGPWVREKQPKEWTTD